MEKGYLDKNLDFLNFVKFLGINYSYFFRVINQVKEKFFKNYLNDL